MSLMYKLGKPHWQEDELLQLDIPDLLKEEIPDLLKGP